MSIVLHNRLADVFEPLKSFYERNGVSAPEILVVDGRRMPQPYRKILFHRNDMTPTLERHWRDGIHLRSVDVRREGAALAREVVLELDRDDRAVEFGAIRIYLDKFDPAPRQRIIECRQPLGRILAEFEIGHRSRPSAYFMIESDPVIAEALRVEGGRPLWGRCNVIRDHEGQVLAEVVEILPPMEENGKKENGHVG